MGSRSPNQSELDADSPYPNYKTYRPQSAAKRVGRPKASPHGQSSKSAVARFGRWGVEERLSGRALKPPCRAEGVISHPRGRGPSRGRDFPPQGAGNPVVWPCWYSWHAVGVASGGSVDLRLTLVVFLGLSAIKRIGGKGVVGSPPIIKLHCTRRSALLLACMEGHAEACELLLQRDDSGVSKTHRSGSIHGPEGKGRRV
jgi:hypothetical protein